MLHRNLCTAWFVPRQFSLVVNGLEVSSATTAHGHEAGEQRTVTLHAVVQLKAGDSVWVKVVTGGHHEEQVCVKPGAQTTFSGLLIH